MSKSKPIALVTGGASGIGLSIASALSRDGYDLILSGTNETKGDAAARELDCTFVRCDLRDPASIHEFARSLPPLDVLVNNAGIAGPTAIAEDVTVEDWQDVMDINLTAPFLMSQAVLPNMKKAGQGAIVNISSTAGRLGYANRAPYAASKWGLHGLTKSLALEAGAFGIRVNAVLPGLVRGERIEGVIARAAAAEGLKIEDAQKRFFSRMAIKRFVEPSEIADMVAFLCSEKAFSISGELISVDCGFE